MHWFLDIFTNQFLITGLSAWAVAQVLKTIIHYFIYKKIDLSRLFGVNVKLYFVVFMR